MNRDMEPGYYRLSCPIWKGMTLEFYKVDGAWWIGKGDDCWCIEDKFDYYLAGATFVSHFMTWPGCEEKCNCANKE